MKSIRLLLIFLLSLSSGLVSAQAGKVPYRIGPQGTSWQIGHFNGPIKEIRFIRTIQNEGVPPRVDTFLLRFNHSKDTVTALYFNEATPVDQRLLEYYIYDSTGMQRLKLSYKGGVKQGEQIFGVSDWKPKAWIIEKGSSGATDTTHNYFNKEGYWVKSLKSSDDNPMVTMKTLDYDVHGNRIEERKFVNGDRRKSTEMTEAYYSKWVYKYDEYNNWTYQEYWSNGYDANNSYQIIKVSREFTYW